MTAVKDCFEEVFQAELPKPSLKRKISL